jgi:hypothetical protein
MSLELYVFVCGWLRVELWVDDERRVSCYTTPDGIYTTGTVQGADGRDLCRRQKMSGPSAQHAAPEG